MVGRPVLARLGRVVLSCAAERGIDASSLAEAASLDPNQLIDPEARIDDRAYRALWELLRERTDDPAIGLSVTQMMSVSALGLIGHLVRASATVGDAFATSIRLHALIEEGGEATIELGDSAAIVRLPPRDTGPWPPELADHVISSYVFLARAWSGAAIVPREVWFQHPAPRDLGAHRRFFGCSLHFDRDVNVVVFDRADLALPLLSADPDLQRYLLEIAEGRLDRLIRPALIEDLRAVARGALGSAELSVDWCARRLRMSRRTLQRRLREHQQSYAEIVDGLRREEAVALLGRGMPLGEIAPRLGFSGPAALRRAVRRWTGLVPSALKNSNVAP